jgi:hypothetical protein
MMNQVLIPALTARLDAEVAEKQRTPAEHEAKATDASADVVVRQRANDAMVAQAPYWTALAAVRPRLSDYFHQVLLAEPLAKHAHNALGSTLDYAARGVEINASRHTCCRDTSSEGVQNAQTAV